MIEKLEALLVRVMPLWIWLYMVQRLMPQSEAMTLGQAKEISEVLENQDILFLL
jgi:hypothetical protein